VSETDYQPELKDLAECITRFLAVNRNKKIAMLGTLAVFNEDGDLEKDKNFMFGYGDIDYLRIINNDMRDRIEDQCNKDGIVSLGD